jgi:putative membrane-bound dehydrogenase-like protein
MLSAKQFSITIATMAVLASCNETGKNSIVEKTADTLTETQRHLPGNALKSLEITDGLEVMLMASEPALKNPTNLDVDDRGRVWVTEAFNYRPAINGNPSNPEGDRIMILEDKDGDGIAETNKIFYQGPEINAPLGICVLGNRVLVSQSPYVWAFYDDNGDDKADRKEIIFQGIGGEQHDHGMHSFSFGPDGKLYFNFGNEGKTLKDKNGKVVLDQDGDEIGPKKYKQGMVFRSEPDGTNVECLASNFRNNYEVAVDSYGTMWQSDNDDDGNRGVRINYVMEYGKYGYVDEMTGDWWSSKRTNMEDSIPERHWHLNDPGVVPNLLQTGSGSPTGMIIYEGSVLPEEFRNSMIHCEPGHNVVRAYPVKKNGAGYSATIKNLLTGEKDQWFRPADIGVAPDGSLIIADWYDPGVGGHGAGDQQKGRIYRIAPKGSAYKMPVFDYTTPETAVIALQSPNLAARYKAYTALKEMGDKAVPAVEKLWNSTSEPAMRARALWILSKMLGGEKYIHAALREKNPDLRITGLRAARQLKGNVNSLIAMLADDKDAQVRRECFIALRHNYAPESPVLWARLAAQYDGKDRWYLEALGIGADRQWEQYFGAYLDIVKDPLRTESGKGIVWRSRADKSLQYLARIAADSTIAWKSRQRYFRAFDFYTSQMKSKVLIQMMAENRSNNIELNAMLLHIMNPAEVRRSYLATETLNNILKPLYGTPQYIELVSQYQLKKESAAVLQLSLNSTDQALAVDAIKQFIELSGLPALRSYIISSDSLNAARLIKTMGIAGTGATVDLLQEFIMNPRYKKQLQLLAADNLGKSYRGEDRVINLLKNHAIREELIASVIEGLHGGKRPDLYASAKENYLPGTVKKVSETKNISLNTLLAVKANQENGKSVFISNCSVCHMVKKDGFDFGPKLTEIGDKLPKEGLFKAIVNPSDAVSFGYENTELVMKDGSKLNGLISGKTATSIDLKYPGGSIQKIKNSEVKSVSKLKESLMPVLYESLSKQEMADLIDYLSSLKK